MQDRQPCRMEDFIQDLIALLTICCIVGSIIQFNHQQRLHLLGITDQKIHGFGLNAITPGLLSFAILNVNQLSQ